MVSSPLRVQSLYIFVGAERRGNSSSWYIASNQVIYAFPISHILFCFFLLCFLRKM